MEYHELLHGAAIAARPEMQLEDFIDAAWSDHADYTDDVASRLAASLSLIASGADVAPYARLVVHVYGEHLSRWGDGVALLEAILARPSCDGDAAGAVRRGIATLRIGRGDAAALEGLGREDAAAALASASSAFAGLGRFGEAIDAFDEAVRLAADDGAPGSPAVRALAAAGNNLAAALETKADRDERETAAMVDAARAGLRYWTLAGTWLEQERAEYRLARSHLAAGDAHAAIEAAKRCVDVCARSGAPDFERFFAHAALALARRAAGDAVGHEAARAEALACFDRIAPDERRWCESELQELGASQPRPP